MLLSSRERAEPDRRTLPSSSAEVWLLEEDAPEEDAPHEAPRLRVPSGEPARAMPPPPLVAASSSMHCITRSWRRPSGDCITRSPSRPSGADAACLGSCRCQVVGCSAWCGRVRRMEAVEASQSRTISESQGCWGFISRVGVVEAFSGRGIHPSGAPHTPVLGDESPCQATCVVCASVLNSGLNQFQSGALRSPVFGLALCPPCNHDGLPNRLPRPARH